VRVDMMMVGSEAPTGHERRNGAAGQGGGIRLAVIDSDTGFLQVLGKRLEGAGWPYRVLASPVPLDAMVAMRLNAVVVDLAVLGPQGWSYLDKLCTRLPHLGVVVCTGQSSVAQRVRGLRLGADDWISKPCHPEELIARVEAVVRRRKRASERVDTGPLVAGELEIRADQFQAFVRGRSVDLTRREFEVLQLLAQAEGKVLQREEIYQAVWGYAMAHGDRSVDVFVRKVRLKLETASPDWSYIHTHFGVGYRFQPERPGGADEAAAFEASLRDERPAPAEATAPAEVSEELPPDPDGAEGRARHVATAR
jgi:DNA-binding response OmpR family regulator